MDILIVLESNKGTLHRMSKEAIVGAQSFVKEQGLSISALAIGKDADALAQELSGFALDEILLAKHDLLSSYSADGFSESVSQVVRAENPKFVMIGHSYQTRDYFPKVSAKLNAPFLPDLNAFVWQEGSPIFIKTVYNGKLSAELVSSHSECTLLSFQAAAFSEENITIGSASIREIEIQLDTSQIRSSAEAPFQEEAGGLDLSSAGLIVSVGRGIEKEDNIAMAKDLAQALSGEIAASRPVVDAGWLPVSHQVGSSGQSVSPNLYLALGISGAIQHVVGMKGSKNIIAINKDADAPIFEIADYGVVGNVLEIVPKLTEAING
ncbi:MAG: electron transfer flavoprotein subunit alpha/FixB family protein [Candidatus Marinimicrobia bacterium]|jgi:electron transfer flavoprotein alpha subunit|nr:electron transfer flavoprotein subunit alpha/FixB family protein [Candidatus Neomarinimicrobiota bacterium]